MDYKLYHDNCLEVMPTLKPGNVDLVLADPPYGTINRIEINGWRDDTTKWDTKIPTKPLFIRMNRVLRQSGTACLFCQEPYTSELIGNGKGNLAFLYRMIWVKNHFANALSCKKAPVKYSEDICVFREKYDVQNKNPLMVYAQSILDYIGKSSKDIENDLGSRRAEHFFRTKTTQFSLCTKRTYKDLCILYGIEDMPGFMRYDQLLKINRAQSPDVIFNLPKGAKYKSDLLYYDKESVRHHPAQKPVLLLEDLIKTYTNPGDTVLDFAMGSGSTGVACANTGRRFIGIEMDQGFFEIAEKRIREAALSRAN